MDLINDILSSEEFRNLLLSIITAIMGLLATHAKTLIVAMIAKVEAQKIEAENKVGKAQVEILESIALTAVRYVQQVFYDSNTEDKFKQAIRIAQKELDGRNISIGGENLEYYIEAAYNTVKKEFDKKADITAIVVDDANTNATE